MQAHATTYFMGAVCGSAAAASHGDKPGPPRTASAEILFSRKPQPSNNSSKGFLKGTHRASFKQLISVHRLRVQEDSWRKHSSSEGIPSIAQNSWRRIHPSVRFKCQHNKGTPLPAPPALQICHAGKEKLDREDSYSQSALFIDPTLAITPQKKTLGIV